MLPKVYAQQRRPPDDLAASHLNLARKIAWNMHGRVGQRVEIDDLLQVAHIGLIEAVHRYEPQPGVPFASYAAIRIRGALIDHLRQIAGQGRAALQMQARMRQARRKLEQRLTRAPDQAELAAELEMDPDEFARCRVEAETATPASLDDTYTDESQIFRDMAPGVEDMLEAQGMKRRLRDAVARLPEREALVLQLYYVEEMNVYEIAAVLNVTTGRVSQIKSAAVEKLRRFLAETE